MFAKLLIVLLASTLAVSKTFKDSPDACSLTEFSCGDGGCVSSDLMCDGNNDCADGSDETCGVGSTNFGVSPILHSRSRRQARKCSKLQWQCRDGSCISFDGKCDGVVDCPDGSDETHALCRNSQCQYNWFRCTYGACVDGTAACNGRQDCADNSDELLPKCRNETDEVRGQFKCQDGTLIPAASHCDGVKDCPDGSDETVRACAAKTCPSYLFQCAYGACVDSGADCNKIVECADGSDEAVELCGGQGVVSPPTSGTSSKPPVSSGDCLLPPYPDHGTYTTEEGGKPGNSYDYVTVTVSCRRGYGVTDKNTALCYRGIWQNPVPQCLPMCELKKSPSIEYRCLIPNVQGSRNCNKFEHNGTIVIPECVAPNYYSPTTLTYMTCYEGSWDHQATCIPGLAKNGTNITILVKDTVEIHVSDITYTVPIFKPISEFYNDNFNNKYGDNDKHNNQISNNSNDNYSNNNNQYSNNNQNGNNDKYSNNNNQNSNNNDKYSTSNANDKINVSYDIDELDWRMGPSTNDKTQSNSKNSQNNNRKIIASNSYATRNNKTNIYFNITNSSVYINADDRLIFSN